VSEGKTAARKGKTSTAAQTSRRPIHVSIWRLDRDTNTVKCDEVGRIDHVNAPENITLFLKDFLPVRAFSKTLDPDTVLHIPTADLVKRIRLGEQVYEREKWEEEDTAVGKVQSRSPPQFQWPKHMLPEYDEEDTQDLHKRTKVAQETDESETSEEEFRTNQASQDSSFRDESQAGASDGDDESE
jgi:hypothetical protein